MAVAIGPSVSKISAQAYRIPTDEPESDGTLCWDATTMVVVEVEAGSVRGLGYTYSSDSAVSLISGKFASIVEGSDAFSGPAIWQRMVQAVRNIGLEGVAACAISAVDVALWDLKAKLLGVSLAQLLGIRRERVPIYSSGGFTSYSEQRLVDQLRHWRSDLGCDAFKIKVGRDIEQAAKRISASRSAVGQASVMIDANGALTPKSALAMAQVAGDADVVWLEEPVTSDDLAGLRFVRERTPEGMAVAAGEYGYTPHYFRRMLDAGAVDVLQVDATRCCGITGFLSASALADAYHVPLSTHTAPALHLHVAAAAPRLLNLEWFHDHTRIETALLDGAPRPQAGSVAPDLSRLGLGLDLKASDAARYAI